MGRREVHRTAARVTAMAATTTMIAFGAGAGAAFGAYSESAPPGYKPIVTDDGRYLAFRYPSDFEVRRKELADGSIYTLTSPTRSAKIVFEEDYSGGVCDYRHQHRLEFQRYFSYWEPKPTVTFRSHRGARFAFSGYTADGRIFYDAVQHLRDATGNPVHYQISIKYPRAQKPEYDAIVDTVINSFMTPL